MYCFFFLRTDEQHCNRLVSTMASTGTTCSSPVVPWYVITQMYFFFFNVSVIEKFFFLGESPMIPEAHSAAVIAHICMVHSSVDDYSKLFLQRLRRCNYVTPKNYLDFINAYSKLLEEKDHYILGEKMLNLSCI